MRVLVLANPHIPCHAPGSNGMERSTYELAEALAQRDDMEVTLAAHPETTPPRGVALVPWHIQPCPPDYAVWGDGERKWLDLAIARACFDLAPQISRFDVVHDNTSSFVPPLVTEQMAPHIRVIKTLRLMPYHPSASLSSGSRVLRCFLSEFQRVWARETGPVVRESPKLDTSAYPTNEYRERGDYAVSVGRVEPRKGHLVALQIAKSMGLELLVCGALADAGYANELQVRGARLVGQLERHVMRSAVEGARCLLWTPLVPEPNGRVIWEALSCGIPVVGSPTGALADLTAMGLTSKYPYVGENLVRATGAGDIPFGYSIAADHYASLYRSDR
jgi:glycosyltransferase involved in cell wall biosynthesis